MTDYLRETAVNKSYWCASNESLEHLLVLLVVLSLLSQKQ